MLIILSKVIAVYIALTGVVFLIRPRSLTGYVGFWKQSKRLYFIGGSRVIMGAVLLWAGPVCRFKPLVFISGILMVIAGLPYFILSVERLKTMFSRWQSRSIASVRILGFSFLAAGILLFIAS